ncbi:MAG: TetR family transcriptional regulator [bacterium]
MKRTKEDALLTKKKLLDTAFSEFLTTGFLESKLEVIAKKSGVTRGAFYWHFKNKADLLESIIKEKDLESLKISTEILESSQVPFEKLRTLVSLNFPDFPNAKQEKNFVKLKIELYKYSNEKGDKRKIAESFMQMCKILIEECKLKGEIKNEIDPETAAHTILCICAGSYIRFNSVQENLRKISNSKKTALDYLNLIHK